MLVLNDKLKPKRLINKKGSIFISVINSKLFFLFNTNFNNLRANYLLVFFFF